MNTSTGQAGDCMKALISSKLIQETRERINENMTKGQTIKEQLLKATRITASIVIKARSFRLNEDVFAAHQQIEKLKRQNIIDKIKEDEKKYNTNYKYAEEVWAKKDKLEAMTIKELMTICKPLKRKYDGPIPKKKIELIAKYKEWHGRPTPTFDISDVNVIPILKQESNENNDLGNEIITGTV